MQTKTDWTKVPAGTMIHVKDYDSEDWNVRKFIRYDAHYNMPFVCNLVNHNGDISSSETSWTFAELIEEQTEVTAVETSVHAVKFENNHVVVPIVVEHKVTQAEYEMIKRVYPNHRVTIIKYLRSLYNLGLVETAKICDSICGLN